MGRSQAIQLVRASAGHKRGNPNQGRRRREGGCGRRRNKQSVQVEGAVRAAGNSDFSAQTNTGRKPSWARNSIRPCAINVHAGPAVTVAVGDLDHSVACQCVEAAWIVG